MTDVNDNDPTFNLTIPSNFSVREEEANLFVGEVKVSVMSPISCHIKRMYCINCCLYSHFKKDPSLSLVVGLAPQKRYSIFNIGFYCNS